MTAKLPQLLAINLIKDAQSYVECAAVLNRHLFQFVSELEEREDIAVPDPDTREERLDEELAAILADDPPPEPGEYAASEDERGRQLGPQHGVPMYFLLGQAIELALKAYLAASGVPEQTLSSKKIGHDI